MNLNKKDSKALLSRYEQGICSEEERLFVEEHYQAIAAQAVDKEYEISAKALKKDTWDAIENHIQHKATITIKFRWIAVAASILLILGFVGYKFMVKHVEELPAAAVFVHKPVLIEELRSANKPISVNQTPSEAEKLPHIVLSDGKIVPLKDFAGEIMANSDGLYYADGHSINVKANQNTIHTLTTPKGYDCKFTLADGTVVWLNAESSISFPLVFSAKSREVSLTGEAYFDVTHDANRPFIVKAKNQAIRVLGTEFNVRAYDREAISRTTLVEGSVEVTMNNYRAVLKPMEQLVLMDNKLTKTNRFDMESVIAWKNGHFRFKGRLKEVMEDLARWYDVDLDYRLDASQNVELEAALTRSRPLPEIIDIVQAATGYKLILKERRLIIMK